MPLKKLSYNFYETSQSTNITNLLLKKQVNETRPRLSYSNLNESTNITNLLSKIQLDEIHPQAIYTSRLLNFQILPEPINCPNQQEFISSRYSKRIRTGQVNTLHSDECSDCIIMDID
ncbi:unnamed protein product [Rhizophagus irregularis]|nr:unnamed protein product [Rhizophagus irregularis]